MRVRAEIVVERNVFLEHDYQVLNRRCDRAQLVGPGGCPSGADRRSNGNEKSEQ